jgi:hypothetical protein
VIVPESPRGLRFAKCPSSRQLVVGPHVSQSSSLCPTLNTPYARPPDPALSVLQRPSDPISAVVPIIEPISVPHQWHDRNTSLVADVSLHVRPVESRHIWCVKHSDAGEDIPSNYWEVSLRISSTNHRWSPVCTQVSGCGRIRPEYVGLLLCRGHYCRHNAYGSNLSTSYCHVYDACIVSAQEKL